MPEIALTQNKIAIVDIEDFEVLSKQKWYAVKSGKTFYAAFSKRKRKPDGTWGGDQIKMHNLILPPAKSLEVDHINGDGLDNRRTNLRLATHSQNIINVGKRFGKSKYKGVSWHKRDKRWQAYININGIRRCLGNFKIEVEAAKAYNKEANKLHGQFARLNIISI